MDFSKEDILNFQIFLGFACYFKVRNILFNALSSTISSDIETLVDNSSSNFLGDTYD